LVPDSGDPIVQLEQFKFDGCVIGLQPGAGIFFEALRNSPLNQRCVLYAFGNPSEAFWYARYGVNVVIQKPFGRSQALKALSATRGLLLYDLVRSLQSGDPTPDPFQDSGFLVGASPERVPPALRSELCPSRNLPDAQGALAPELIPLEPLLLAESIGPAGQPALAFPGPHPFTDFGLESKTFIASRTAAAASPRLKLAPVASMPTLRPTASTPPSLSSNSQFIRAAIIAALLVSVAVVGIGARMLRTRRSSPALRPQLPAAGSISTSGYKPASPAAAQSQPLPLTNPTFFSSNPVPKNSSSLPAVNAAPAAARDSNGVPAASTQPQAQKRANSEVVAEDVVIRTSALRALSAPRLEAPKVFIPALAPSLPAGDRARLVSAFIPPQVTDPEVLRRVDAIYPAFARQARLEGKVVLEASIAKDGSVSKVARLSGSSLLAEAATAALKNWRYMPAFADGKPVESVAQVTFNFTLNAK
jgi:protein TonB